MQSSSFCKNIQTNLETTFKWWFELSNQHMTCELLNIFIWVLNFIPNHLCMKTLKTQLPCNLTWTFEMAEHKFAWGSKLSCYISRIITYWSCSNGSLNLHCNEVSNCTVKHPKFAHATPFWIVIQTWPKHVYCFCFLTHKLSIIWFLPLHEFSPFTIQYPYINSIN